MICPRCGKTIPDGSAWCPMCGGQVAPPPQSWPNQQPPPLGGVPPYPPPYPYQYYPGQPPYPPPQAKPDDSLKKVIIYVVIFIVIIAAVTVIASLVLLGITSSFEEPPSTRVTVNMASPSMEQSERDGTPVWDATLNINRITPRDVTVDWTSVRVRIVSASGATLLPQTMLTMDSGAYDETAPIMVEVWYDETLAGNTAMSPGDFFKVTGISSAYEGANVLLYSHDELIGSATLPTNFP
jgi:hypothetical protein